MKKLYFLLSLSLFIPQAHSMDLFRRVVRGGKDEIVNPVTQRLVDELRKIGLLPQNVTVKEPHFGSFVDSLLSRDGQPYGYYSSFLRTIYLSDQPDLKKIRILSLLSLQATTKMPIEKLITPVIKSIRCDKCRNFLRLDSHETDTIAYLKSEESGITEESRKNIKMCEELESLSKIEPTEYTCPIHTAEIASRDESEQHRKETEEKYAKVISFLKENPQEQAGPLLRDLVHQDERALSEERQQTFFDTADWNVYQNPFDQ